MYAVVLLGVAACSTDDIPAVKSRDGLVGQYQGLRDDGMTVTFAIEARQTGPSAFLLKDLRGVAYPFVDLYGYMEGDTLDFDRYECIDCDFLPSPGGTERKYSATLESSGMCFMGNDSIHLHVEYVHTGTGASEYTGWVYAAKID